MAAEEQPEFYQPALFQSFTGLIAAESTRLGGYSEGPYSSLNLGLNTGDNQEVVESNRALFFGALGWSVGEVASAYQVHGENILQVRRPCREEGFDALITDTPGIFLTVTVADCTPVLIFDPAHAALAAVHAGWRGTAAHILQKTVEKMQVVFGTNPSDCLAYIGTCIDYCSYEVDADVARYFDATFVHWSAESGKYMLDLKRANEAQLLKVGVIQSNIEISPYSTVLNNDRYFSYRKEQGVTGRMLCGIGLR